jgi:dTDP-4-dehydrorhamnose reductase
VLWERTAPNGLASADWRWADERLIGIRRLGIEAIAGLVHHGSGPRHTSLLDPAFAQQLAGFAGAVAARYPWIGWYTPVNEPLTTARFAALYGVWYPHERDDRRFVEAVMNQCRATVLAMRAIRKVNPEAKLVQTDDLGKTWSTPEMAPLARFYNERRWLAWDLLCGRVDDAHPLWDYLMNTGLPSASFDWFRENPCPPDILGVNYYITSERWLDHRLDRYPERYAGRYRDCHCVDIETPRAFAVPTPGLAPLLREAWERYRIPIAITEAHIDAHREDQLRWLSEVWRAAERVRGEGADIRAVTVWALFGSFDWNSLVTEDRGYYEPGPFDVRSDPPRPTVVTRLMRELSSGRKPSHPVLQGDGWWRRPGRFLCPPVSIPEMDLWVSPHPLLAKSPQPLLIVGATGTLGRAFARICSVRNIAFRLVGRAQMDMADAAAVEHAIREHRPWAVVNAGGYVRVDEAEVNHERCYRENTLGPVVLAIACARHGLPLLSFSSDLVFDGTKGTPYVEDDLTAPLNVYGRTKAEAEQRVLAIHPQALIVRTSAFFGPWDSVNFVSLALAALSERRPFIAASDITVSPTYVPDLVHAALNLLIDGDAGLWHLSNRTAITWAELARRAAQMAGISTDTLEPRQAARLASPAQRPACSALASARGEHLPSLDDALTRYLHLRVQAAEEDETGLEPLQGRM